MPSSLMRKFVLACACVPVLLMSSSTEVVASRLEPCVSMVPTGGGVVRECPCGGTCEYNRYFTSCCTPNYRCYYVVEE